jgi:phage shock protein A
MMALHMRYAPPKMEITSSQLLMLPSQGILGSLKSAASKAQSGYNKALETKQKAEVAAKKALEKGQQLQAQANALAEKAEKTGKQLQQKAEQIQQQADQAKQQYEQAKASVQSIGQTLTTPPPSSSPAEVAKEVVKATAPIQALRRHRYY